MNAIRIIAEILLILTGVIHVLLFVNGPLDENAQLYLVFGIFYFAIGLLMFFKPGFSSAWGIIFPLIGLIGGVLVIGSKQWNTMIISLLVIDAIIVSCCAFLFFKVERK